MEKLQPPVEEGKSDLTTTYKKLEDGKGRPRINKSQTENKFRVGDSVYVSTGTSRGLDGPYLVASVPEPRKYTLAFENGTRVEEGRVFDELVLQFAA